MNAPSQELPDRSRSRSPLRIEVPAPDIQNEDWEDNEQLGRPRQDVVARSGATSISSLLRRGVFGGIRVIAAIIEAILHLFPVILSGLLVVFGRFLIMVAIIYGISVQITEAGFISYHIVPPIVQHHVNFTNAVPLAVRPDHQLNITHFRLAVNEGMPERSIKYASVRLDVKALAVRKSTYSRIGVVQIPRLPEGSWNAVELGLSPDGKEVEVVSTTCDVLPGPGMKDTWHQDSFRFVDLEVRPMPSSTERLKLVYHPSLNTRNNLAVMKYAPFPEHVAGIERENKIYHHLRGTSVAPKFLGHVTDPGDRVIGFLIEYIWDGRPADKNAADDDGFSDLALAKCKGTLGKLHSLRVAHNASRTGDCLIRRDGSAVLVNFEHATMGNYPYRFNRVDGYDQDFALMEKPAPKGSAQEEEEASPTIHASGFGGMLETFLLGSLVLVAFFPLGM